MSSTQFLRVPDGLLVIGDLQVGGSFTIPNAGIVDAMISSSAAISRVKLAQEALQKFPVQLTSLRVWDAMQTLLPGTAASDDLALIGGTWASASPTVRSSDSKNTTVTQRARFLTRVPECYDAGEDFKIRVNAAMSVVASSTATVDLEVFKSDKAGGIGSDLVSTLATSINSTSFANVDFVLTAAALAPGDWLDCRLTVAITDVATASPVIAIIGNIERLCDIRG